MSDWGIWSNVPFAYVQDSSVSDICLVNSTEKAYTSMSSSLFGLLKVRFLFCSLFPFLLCSTLETAQLLLVVSDGRGLFLEGKDRVLAAVQAARNANIFVIFVVLDNPSSRVSDH